jgi:hypothetical protein
MSEVYRLFAGDHCTLDFSLNAAQEAYLFETTGKGNLKRGVFSDPPYNGYAVGKHWMDATVKMWREDIRKGLLMRRELYEDPLFEREHWWLNRVLKNV